MKNKPVIVGYEWHNFVGEEDFCKGVLGNSTGEVCILERNASIHSEECKPNWMKKKEGSTDTGNRTQYSNGMVREVNPEKPAFDLLLPNSVDYEHQMLTRFAKHMAKGAVKYSPRNWENGVGEEELARAKASAHRHMMQWLLGETDEDHAAAVYFNIMQAEYIKHKLGKQ